MRGSNLQPLATQDGIARGVALAALALGLGLALNVNRPIRRAIKRHLAQALDEGQQIQAAALRSSVDLWFR